MHSVRLLALAGCMALIASPALAQTPPPELRIRAGTLAPIQAMKPAAKWEQPGGFISGDAFVETVHKSIGR